MNCEAFRQYFLAGCTVFYSDLNSSAKSTGKHRYKLLRGA